MFSLTENRIIPLKLVSLMLKKLLTVVSSQELFTFKKYEFVYRARKRV